MAEVRSTDTAARGLCGRPVWSVVIPTYNRRALVVEAVRSVLAQNYAGIEIIVVDDGSTDGTAEALRRFGAKVRYLHQDNRGPAAAKNFGIAQAQGQFVSFLDSDDLWMSGKLETELKLFERYPEAEAVAGNACAFVENVLCWSDVFAARYITFDDAKPRYFDWSMAHFALGSLCTTGALTLRREALCKLGASAFDESLRLDEDWDMEFRMFRRCRVLLYPEVLTTIRTFDDGTRLFYSAPGKPKGLAEKRMIWRIQMDILDRYLGCPEWGVEEKAPFRRQRQTLKRKLAESFMAFEEGANGTI